MAAKLKLFSLFDCLVFYSASVLAREIMSVVRLSVRHTPVLCPDE